MKIEIGKLYENDTWNYLVPCLRYYGDSFLEKFNLVFKLAIGIGDKYLEGSVMEEGRNLYIMIDTMYRKEVYEHFFNWVKYQPYYKGEYIPNTSKESLRKQIIILEVPEECHNAYDMFVQSRYSEMYTKEQLDVLFNKPNQSYFKKVLQAHTDLHESFIKKVNKTFGTNISSFSGHIKEVKLPLIEKEEVFHSNSNSYYVKNINKNSIHNPIL